VILLRVRLKETEQVVVTAFVIQALVVWKLANVSKCQSIFAMPSTAIIVVMEVCV